MTAELNREVVPVLVVSTVRNDHGRHVRERVPARLQRSRDKVGAVVSEGVVSTVDKAQATALFLLYWDAAVTFAETVAELACDAAGEVVAARAALEPVSVAATTVELPNSRATTRRILFLAGANSTCLCTLAPCPGIAVDGGQS